MAFASMKKLTTSMTIVITLGQSTVKPWLSFMVYAQTISKSPAIMSSIHAVFFSFIYPPTVEKSGRRLLLFRVLCYYNASIYRQAASAAHEPSAAAVVSCLTAFLRQSPATNTP